MSASSDQIAELKARVAALEAERRQALLLAQTDTLTGLLNRGAFAAELASRIRAVEIQGGPLALFLVDLDRFKHLNDTHGHHAGDLYLAEVGRRLQGHARPGELVARLGGDEFALISHRADVSERAEALVGLLAKSYVIHGRPLSPGASVGVALRPPGETDSEGLHRMADMALYRAKLLGGHRWAAFDEALRVEADRRATLEADLRRAVPAGEIEPWFQPVIHAADGAIAGVEVLARWRHPAEGLLEPARFMPLAAELGLIGALDETLFHDACVRAAPWVAEGLIEEVSFNAASRDLHDPAFSRRLLARLARTGLPAQALTLEIPESFLIEDMALARRHIGRLHARGVRVAIDDFGGAYANPRALMRLPVHTVKLHPALTADMARDSRLARLGGAVLATVRGLGVRIAAKGVADEAQAVALRAAGCERMQGFWFARPMPAEEMDLFLWAGASHRMNGPRVAAGAGWTPPGSL